MCKCETSCLQEQNRLGKMLLKCQSVGVWKLYKTWSVISCLQTCCFSMTQLERGLVFQKNVGFVMATAYTE